VQHVKLIGSYDEDHLTLAALRQRSSLVGVGRGRMFDRGGTPPASRRMSEFGISRTRESAWTSSAKKPLSVLNPGKSTKRFSCPGLGTLRSMDEPQRLSHHRRPSAAALVPTTPTVIRFGAVSMSESAGPN